MVKLTILGPKPGEIFKSPKENFAQFVYDQHRRPTSVLSTDTVENYNKWLEEMFTKGVNPNPNNLYSLIYLEMMSTIDQKLQTGESVKCLVGGCSGVDTIFGMAALSMIKQHPGKVSIHVYNYDETAEKSGLQMHRRLTHDYGKHLATQKSGYVNNEYHVLARNMIDKYATKRILPKKCHPDKTIVQTIASNKQLVNDTDELVVVSTGHIVGSRTATAIRNTLKQGKEVSVINSLALQFKIEEAFHKIPSQTAYAARDYGFVEKFLPKYFDDRTKKYHYTQQRLDGAYFNRSWNPTNKILPETNSSKSNPTEGYVYHSKWGLLDNKKSDALNYLVENESLYVGGSNRHSKLTKQTKIVLDKAIANNKDILVTDTRGIDRTIQEYLRQKNYKHVKIYTVFSEVKNRLDPDWEVRTIPLIKDLDLKDYVHPKSVAPKRSLYNMRDFQMAQDATSAYCIVNSGDRVLGNETPYIHTAFRMKAQGKDVIVEDYHECKCVTIKGVAIPKNLVDAFTNFKQEYAKEASLFGSRAEMVKPLNHEQVKIEGAYYDL